MITLLPNHDVISLTFSFISYFLYYPSEIPAFISKLVYYNLPKQSSYAC